jgi:hypothetical protein
MTNQYNQFRYCQPKGAGDLKSSKDCMIRSVAIATGREYSEVYQIMKARGWRAKRSSSDKDWEGQITGTLKELGFKATRHSFPGIKGQPRKTAMTMPSAGTWILRVSKHVACLKDGVLLDTFDCRESCVYFAWEIQPI